MKSSAWFTLPELIIVVAILVTLGTIAFVSYSEYTISSRDAKRSSDLVTVRSNLSTYSAKNGGYPKPASFVEVRATVATGSTVLLRQGIIDSALATSLDIAGGGKDPSTNQGYTLSVDDSGKRAQVLAYFEKTGAEAQLSSNFPSIIQSVYAEDTPLSDKFPVSAWEKLWTFVQSGSLIPLEQTQTGTIALPTLSGSGFMVIGWCLTTERMTPVATGYPEGLYEGACEYIPPVTTVNNSMGVDGDEKIVYDPRPYNHPAWVIAANSGNPDFYNNTYKLIKINGKWVYNQNNSYPASPNFNYGTGYSFYCPVILWVEDCSKVVEKGYIYGWYSHSYCPVGWSSLDLTFAASLTNIPENYVTEDEWMWSSHSSILLKFNPTTRTFDQWNYGYSASMKDRCFLN
jgi:prepilin-type N-terminal cleavage/methylation domain-containing protein